MILVWLDVLIVKSVMYASNVIHLGISKKMEIYANVLHSTSYRILSVFYVLRELITVCNARQVTLAQNVRNQYSMLKKDNAFVTKANIYQKIHVKAVLINAQPVKINKNVQIAKKDLILMEDIVRNQD